MPEILRETGIAKRRREAIEGFLGALVKGSRTVTLYKEGHSIVGQVTGRVNQLLKNAIGEEPNLPLELKSKRILFEEEELTESPETVLFATALHSLGVGQVVFTPRLSDEGLLGFMRLLVWKPTADKSLSDMQKELSTRRIDGLQIISILSFVVTGEQEEDSRNPGELTEEQIAAITSAGTAPDFLYLLLKQAEAVNNKAAEEIVQILDQALNRDIPIEQFEAAMPWDSYDERLRARWDALRADFERADRNTRPALVGRLTLIDEASLSARKDHAAHDALSSFSHARDALRTVLRNPVGEQQPRFALFAYARLLEDLGRIGDLKALLEEFGMWRELAADPRWRPQLEELKRQVQAKVPSFALAANLARAATEREPGDESLQTLHDFVLTVGATTMPPLLEEFRKTTGKEERARLTKFLAGLYARFGSDSLLERLKDPDYFFVIGVIGILVELGVEDLAERIGFLLDHEHEKVRAAVIQTFRRVGGPVAARALADFIASGKHDEQAQIAVTTLSLLPGEGVDDLLVEAYGKNDDYEVRIAIVTALGRHPGPDTADFLRTVSQATLKERILDFFAQIRGAKESLRVVALKSLKQIDGEKK